MGSSARRTGRRASNRPSWRWMWKCRYPGSRTEPGGSPSHPVPWPIGSASTRRRPPPYAPRGPDSADPCLDMSTGGSGRSDHLSSYLSKPACEGSPAPAERAKTSLSARRGGPRGASMSPMPKPRGRCAQGVASRQRSPHSRALSGGADAVRDWTLATALVFSAVFVFGSDGLIQALRCHQRSFCPSGPACPSLRLCVPSAETSRPRGPSSPEQALDRALPFPALRV